MDTTEPREVPALGTTRHRALGSWTRTAAKAVAATALASAGLVFFAVPAFAHNNVVTGTATCASGSTGGFDITWTVANDFNLSEVATVTSATGGVSTVSGSPAHIVASPGKPFKSATLTQVLPASTTGPATLAVKGVWSDKFITSDTGSTPLPTGCPPPPTQSLSGHIYLCPGGTSPTTTEVPGGTIGATGPQTVASGANPLLPTNVAAGQYTISATAPTGYQLVVCNGSSTVASGGHSATEAVTVPVGGQGNGVFYVTTVPAPAVSGASGSAGLTSSTPPAPAHPAPSAPATAPAGSQVQGATSVHTGEPWAGSEPLVMAAVILGSGLFGTGVWRWRRRRLATTAR
jgi:hypothetical protein